MVQSLKKTFNAPSGILNNIKKILPLNIGIPRSFINNKNMKYIVEVSSTDPKMNMYAFLQEKFSFSVTSNWEDSGLMGGATKILSDATQFVSGRTLVNTMASRRKWRGTSPIAMQLKLKLEAFDNVKNDVLLPCYMFQSLALPYGASKKTGGSSWFLSPPGPNPFYMPELDGNTGDFAGFGRGDEIKVVIGGFLIFQSVIVRSVDIVFETRMSDKGPVGAEITLNIETYEMFTKQDLLNSYVGVGPDDVPSVVIEEEKRGSSGVTGSF